MERTGAQATVETSQQIRPEELAAIAARGIRSIICNRPDGEEPDQPPAAEIMEAAQQHRLAFAHVPVTSSGITDADAETMRRALDRLPGPVLAYCRSGARSRTLLDLAGVQRR